jgi:hypothetical protein
MGRRWSPVTARSFKRPGPTNPRAGPFLFALVAPPRISPGWRSPAELGPECLSPVARWVLNRVGQLAPHFSELEIGFAAVIGRCRFRLLSQLSSARSKELNFYLGLSHCAAFEVGFYGFRTGAIFARRAQLLRRRNSDAAKPRFSSREISLRPRDPSPSEGTFRVAVFLESPDTPHGGIHHLHCQGMACYLASAGHVYSRRNCSLRPYLGRHGVAVQWHHREPGFSDRHAEG